MILFFLTKCSTIGETGAGERSTEILGVVHDLAGELIYTLHVLSYLQLWRKALISPAVGPGLSLDS